MAFGGEITDADISQGELVRFHGSIFNNATESGASILSMNVSMQRAGSNQISVNISKAYDPVRQEFDLNTTFTDYIAEEMNYEPGSYNVSIFFVIRASDAIGVAGDIHYSLFNETMLIRGISQPLQVVNIFLVLIGLGAAIYLFLYIQGRRN